MSTVPLISYATPDTDGLPALVPEAEMLIDEGRGPESFSDLFVTRAAARLYFIKSIERRYDLPTIGTVCVVCGDKAEYMAVVGWLIRISDSEFRKMTTGHAVCERCMEAWMQRAQRVNEWRAIVKVAGWTAIVAWLLLFIPVLLADSQYAGVMLLAVFVGVLGGFAVLERSWRWFARTTPPAIRDLGFGGMQHTGVLAFDRTCDAVADLHTPIPTAHLHP